MQVELAENLLSRLKRDPVFFCRRVLGVEPWAKQVEVLHALRDHDRVAVRSGHGTGKSFIASAAALWFLYSHYPAKVVTTAPTWNQVRNILWNEIRRLYRGSLLPLGGKALEEKLKLADDAFAVGLSTDESDRFQGYHAEHVLVILDEAPGVREDIWHVAETLLTGRVGKILAIGNPTRPSGLFYEAFSPGSSWEKIHISCLDSPNLTERERQYFASLSSQADDDSEKLNKYTEVSEKLISEEKSGNMNRSGKLKKSAPLNALRYPKVVTHRWIEARAKDWGASSPLWQSRVLGQFPDDDASLLVPRQWLEKSIYKIPPVARVAPTPSRDGKPSGSPCFPAGDSEAGRYFPPGAEKLFLGIDVARSGSDETVFLIRSENSGDSSGEGAADSRIELIESYRGWSTMSTAGRAVALIEKYGLEAASVFVDDTGLGAGVTDRLRELGHDVNAFVSASRASAPAHFVNLRAECFWRLRRSLSPDPGNVCLNLPCDSATLRRELSALTFHYSSTGAIQIADKVALRGRLSGSPNQADALAMTFADPIGTSPSVTIF